MEAFGQDSFAGLIHDSRLWLKPKLALSIPINQLSNQSDATSPLDRVSLKRANLGGERERGANDGTQYKRNYIISDTRSNGSSDT